MAIGIQGEATAPFGHNFGEANLPTIQAVNGYDNKRQN